MSNGEGAPSDLIQLLYGGLVGLKPKPPSLSKIHRHLILQLLRRKIADFGGTEREPHFVGMLELLVEGRSALGIILWMKAFHGHCPDDTANPAKR